MDFLPLFHNLRGRLVLVVGGGDIALRKARLLTDAGARLRVVAPDITPPLHELLEQHEGEGLLQGYQAAQLDGVQLVIAATDDETLNAQVSRDAQARNLPVNAVDAPEH